ncbi:multidrug effflux MFS transporter [Oceanibium sediminis]|uniref:multidrug effflux MFS transporter n=1 Tax=Oceanibium sediminis TaxID=2026339 RepID=UPI000DD458B2|nr:multidrug effflux MFS transporter [Oceanibium sediminis]
MTAGSRQRPGPAVPYILAACTAVSVLSTDLIVPSIPDLPEVFDTSVKLAQMTVSINLAAYALAQLVHGPLADAFGRKRLLVGSFVLFAVISVLCALAPTMESLLTGRFVQGLLSSVPSVVIILIIRELYDEKRALKVMALYGATLGLAPAIGPLLGGYLHVWIGWQAGFWLIAIMAIAVMLAVVRIVPESLPEAKPLNLAGSLRDYAQLLAFPGYLGAAMGVSLLFGAYFSYITAAPVIFIDVLGLPTERYGLSHVAIVGAYIIGNIIATRLSNRFAPGQLLRIASVGMLAAMGILLGAVLGGAYSVAVILAAMSLYGVFLAFVLAAGPLVVLEVATDAPQGPASALLGSIQLGMAALGGYLCAHYFDGQTPRAMAVVMTGMVCLGAVLVWAATRRGPVAPEPVPAD